MRGGERMEKRTLSVEVDGHRVPTEDMFIDLIMAQSRRIERTQRTATAATILAVAAIAVAIIALLQ